MAAWLIILIYAVVIITIVLIHEAGHFVTAKRFGIKVEEFFVGFGPRLWSFRRGETEYGIKLIPAGGYVRIAGMNPFEEISPEEAPRTFGSKPVWQRAIVIGAGPVTHFVMALLFLMIFFMAVGLPTRFVPRIEAVCSLHPTDPTDCSKGPPSPAQRVGLQPGDRVISIGGRRIPVSGDQTRWVDYIVSYTRAHVGQPVSLEVLRDGRVMHVTATPEPAKLGKQTVGRLGVSLGDAVVARHRYGPISATVKAGQQFGVLVKAVVTSLGKVFGPSGLARIWQVLIGSKPRDQNSVVSVVGGGRIAVEAARAGAWETLFGLLVAFNIFIGILNLVPLPPLDGGHLAVLAYEKIRGRRPDVRKLVPLTAVVAGFMIVFAIAITYLDIVNPVPNPFR